MEATMKIKINGQYFDTDSLTISCCFDGKVVKMRKTTTENSTTMQEEYHEQCRQFAAEYLNIEIPLPNEKLTLNL